MAQDFDTPTHHPPQSQPLHTVFSLSHHRTRLLLLFFLCKVSARWVAAFLLHSSIALNHHLCCFCITIHQLHQARGGQSPSSDSDCIFWVGAALAFWFSLRGWDQPCYPLSSTGLVHRRMELVLIQMRLFRKESMVYGK